MLCLGHAEVTSEPVPGARLKKDPSGARVTPESVMKADRLAVCGGQTSNDLPQPQLWRALGLVILKPPPVSASLKSTTAP